MTERAFSPESAKDTTSNGRMGEYALSIAQEIIPKSPSYMQVARVRMQYDEIKRMFNEDSDEVILAKIRYDEYLSRMDHDEDGLMSMEYNRLVNKSIADQTDNKNL